MLHQCDEERQIPRRDPLFIQGQDKIAALGGDEKIRVLDTFGDPLAGQHLAEVVERDEGPQFVVGNIGINGHRLSATSARLVRPARLAYSRTRGDRRYARDTIKGETGKKA